MRDFETVLEFCRPAQKSPCQSGKKGGECQRQGAQSWLLNEALTKDISFYPLPVLNTRATHMSSHEKKKKKRFLLKIIKNQWFSFVEKV